MAIKNLGRVVGKDGKDGKSAYEIWLEQGNTGTEQDFLDSLKATGTGGGTSVTGSGLTTEQINALDGMFKVCAFIKEDVSTEYNAFITAFTTGGGGDVEPDNPDTEKTLVSISATYTGGNVTVGTAVNSLTGITVKANYSDGSTATITDYTLIGTIGEGSNTITVSYSGKTTTFTVVGVADGGVSNTTEWTDGVAYTFDWIENEYIKQTGEVNTYDGWCRTPFLYCEGASRIDFTNTNSQMANYSAFYDVDKQFVSSFYPNSPGYVDIPENAVYFAVSGPSSVISKFTATPRQ